VWYQLHLQLVSKNSSSRVLRPLTRRRSLHHHRLLWQRSWSLLQLQLVRQQLQVTALGGGLQRSMQQLRAATLLGLQASQQQQQLRVMVASRRLALLVLLPPRGRHPHWP
jgi:hypothetical protein